MLMNIKNVKIVGYIRKMYYLCAIIDNIIELINFNTYDT